MKRLQTHFSIMLHSKGFPESTAILVTCTRDLLWLLGLRTAGSPIVHCAVVSAQSQQVPVVTRTLEMSNMLSRHPRYPKVVPVTYDEGDNATDVLLETLRPFRHICVDGYTINASVLRKILKHSEHPDTVITLEHSPIARCRMQKDACELGMMQRAARLVGDAMHSVTQHGHASMTETELAAIATTSIMHAGGEASTYPPFVHSGPIRGCLGHCPADGAVELGNRQLTFIELGASVGGYHAAKMHTLFTGQREHIPDTVLQAESAVGRALDAMVSQAVDGAICKEVAKAGLDEMRNLEGWEAASRLGYCIGISQGTVDWGEAEVIGIGMQSETKLLPNTTLHLIPHMKHVCYGTVAFSKCVVVQLEGGAIDLCPSPKIGHKISCIPEDVTRCDKWLAKRILLTDDSLNVPAKSPHVYSPDVAEHCIVSSVSVYRIYQWQATEALFPNMHWEQLSCQQKRCVYAGQGSHLVTSVPEPPTHVLFCFDSVLGAAAITDCLGDEWGHLTRFLSVEPQERGKVRNVLEGHAEDTVDNCRLRRRCDPSTTNTEQNEWLRKKCMGKSSIDFEFPLTITTKMISVFLQRHHHKVPTNFMYL